MLKSLMRSAPASRRGGRLPALLLALPGVFGLASSAFAATLTVTNTSDAGAGSLRGALAAAAPGDTVAFDAGAFPAGRGTVIALTGARIAVSKNLTVQGPGAGTVTISDSNDGILGVTGSSQAHPITVRLSGLTLANGNGTSATSNGSGGGVYAFAASLTVADCVFTGDTANGSGGAISSTGSTLSIAGCTFSGNAATSGGAIGLSGGTASLTNCTVSGNSTNGGGLGGGVYNNGTSLTLTNCTVVGNAAVSSQSSPGQGGGLYNDTPAAGGTIVQSCIINGNSASAGGDVSGSFVSRGSNIIGDPNGAAYGFTGPHDQVYVNPTLDPYGLRDNGGPTPTIAVLPGSPAVGGDYAAVTQVDQRGVARTAAQHTVGAFEYKTTHTHLLWNNADGRVSVWNVNPDGTHADFLYGPFIEGPGSVWSATALAEGPDGVLHILWNNTDKRVSLWDVSSSGNFVTRGTYGPYVEGAGSVWSATALVVGPDNVPHILWDNTDTRASLWDVSSSGGSVTRGTYGPFVESAGSVWTAKDLSVGPDSMVHILWDNTDKRVSLWDVNADGSHTTRATYGSFIESAGSVWLAQALSVGPDNVPHILWANTDARASLWNVGADGGFITLGTYGPYIESAGSVWSAKGLSTGPNDDLHILWANTDTRASLWDVDGVGGHVTRGTYGPFTDGAPGNIWTVTAVVAGP